MCPFSIISIDNGIAVIKFRGGEFDGTMNDLFLNARKAGATQQDHILFKRGDCKYWGAEHIRADGEVYGWNDLSVRPIKKLIDQSIGFRL